jgi:hypothetical protein
MRKHKKNNKRFNKRKWFKDLSRESLKPQSGFNTEHQLKPQAGMVDFCMSPITSHINEKVVDAIKKLVYDTTDIVEVIAIFAHGLTSAKTWVDYCVAFGNFYKHLSPGAMMLDLAHKFKEIFNYDFTISHIASSVLEPQAGVRDLLKSAREAFTNFSMCVESDIVARIRKMVLYILSTTLADKLGFKYSDLGYSELEEEKYRRKYNTGNLTFVSFLMDTTLFLLEKGIQVYDTCNFMNFFHTEDTYATFQEDYNYIVTNAIYLPNPDSHNIVISDFLEKCDNTVATGNIICEKLRALKKQHENMMTNRMVVEITSIKNKYLVLHAAKAARDVPFSILVYGTSGIGKSSITTKIFSMAAKTLGLKDESQKIYTRSPGEKHWNGFNSSQWGLLIDDIAALNPAKAADDPSITEILQIVNTVSFSPEMASIEDKGKCPFLCKVVVATTNKKNLNAPLYFSNPAAILRRFPYVLTVEVKREFAINGTTMLDADKMAEYLDEYGCEAPAWLFTVEKIQAVGNASVEVSIHDKVECDIFYPWLAKVIKLHAKQNKILHNAMRNKQEICVHDNFGHCGKCQIIQTNIESTFFDESSMDSLSCSDCDDMDNGNSEFDCKAQSTQLRPYFGKQEDELEPTYSMIRRFLKSYVWFSMGFWFHLRNIPLRFYTLWLHPPPPRRVRTWRGWASYNWSMWDFAASTSYTQYNDMYPGFNFRPFSYRQLGKEIASSFVTYPLVWAGITTAVVAAIAAYKTINATTNVPEAQGSRMSAPVPKEKENINSYYNSGSMVVPLPQCNNPKLQDTYAQALNSLSKCVMNLLVFKDDNKQDYHTVNIISLGANDFLAPSHIFRDGRDKFHCCLIVTHKGAGINGNVDTFLLTKDDMSKFTHDDLIVIRILNTPPRPSIENMFTTMSQCSELNHPGTLLYRDTMGVIEQIYAIRVSVGKTEKYVSNNIQYTLENQPEYVLSRPTFDGLCGALICVESQQNGITIVGIHTAGSGERGRGFSLTQNGLHNMIATIKTPKTAVMYDIYLSVPSIKVELSDTIHPKAPVRFKEEGQGEIYGSLPGARASPKSQVVPTLIAQAVQQRMNLSTTAVAPNMSTPRAKHHALRPMMDPVDMDSTILNECVASFANDIIAAVPFEEWEQIHLYDDTTVINGAAGVAYVDSLNFNTSMGFPYNCSKRGYLLPIAPTEAVPDGKTFVPEIMEAMFYMETEYQLGFRCNPVFKAHLKDEPISQRKSKIGKVRVFAGAPVAFSLLVRKYFLPFVRLIQNNKFAWECAVGTNATSKEWGEMKTYLTRFGTKIANGDYGEYDKKMAAKLVRAAFEVMIVIARWLIKHQPNCKITETDITVMIGIATDTSYPLMDFFGELIQFFCSNPSGHPLTVIINCIANSLYMRYAFSILSVSTDITVRDFKEYVALITYGDDNIMNISPRIPWFNHTSIQKALKTINVDYTMPDKVSDSVEYITLLEADFLKRKFVDDDELGVCLAPLDISSIAKMLNIHVLSKNITQVLQTVDIIRSANREFWFHGKQTFTIRHAQLLKVISDVELEPYFTDAPLLGFEDIKKSLDFTYKGIL